MDIYREIILDHFRDPRNRGHLDHPHYVGDATNTSCGDTLTLELCVDEHRTVTDVAFSGTGCAISQAAASLLTDAMKGKTFEEIRAMTREDVFRLLGGPISPGRENCALLILRGRDTALLDAHD
jgi:nitrogen fixation NifU-like protein